MSYTDWDLVEIRESGDGQKGLFARRSLEAGAVIGAYDGRATTVPVHDGRLELSGTPWRHADLIQLARVGARALVLAPIGDFDGIDFANHSCRPNARVERGVVLTTARAVLQGEEITWDYRSSDVLPEGISCWCDPPLCTI
jgi:SET domain-containing protein